MSWTTGNYRDFWAPCGYLGVSPVNENKARKNPISPDRSEDLIMIFLVKSGEY